MLRNIEAGPREVLEPEVRERPPSALRNIDGGPLWALSVFPAAVTTEVEDIDGDPLGVLAVGPVATITEVEDVDGGPWGVLAADPTAATIEVEDVDDGPLGGAGDMSGSSHHLSWIRR
jgi:hypothetical protein